MWKYFQNSSVNNVANTHCSMGKVEDTEVIFAFVCKSEEYIKSNSRMIHKKL